MISVEGRMNFQALVQRLRTSSVTVKQRAAAPPASFVAFDLLAYGGIDLRT